MRRASQQEKTTNALFFKLTRCLRPPDVSDSDPRVPAPQTLNLSAHGLEPAVYGDFSSLPRLYRTFTWTLLYGDVASLLFFTGTLGLFSMEVFPFHSSLQGLYGDSFTGTLLYGDCSSLRGLFSMETFPLHRDFTVLYGVFFSMDPSPLYSSLRWL